MATWARRSVVDRDVRNVEATGSNPVESTNVFSETISLDSNLIKKGGWQGLNALLECGVIVAEFG